MTGGLDPGRQVRFELGLEPALNSETVDVWEGARVNLGPFGVLVIYTREYLNEVDPDHDQVSVSMCELAVRVPAELAPLVTLTADADAGRRSLSTILDVRDDAIRAALAADINYADLESVTDLSRSALDAIRRSARSRGTP